MTPEEMMALLERLLDEEAANPLTDDELAALDAELTRITNEEAAKGAEADLEAMAEAASNIERIRAESSARETAATERAAQAQEILDRITPPPSEAEAEGEVGDGGETGDPPPVAEQVAAAGSSVPPTPPARPRLPSLARLAERRPTRAKPVPTATEAAQPRAILASADLPGLAAGMPVDAERWAYSVANRIQAIRDVKTGGADGERIYLGKITADYPDERMLTGDELSDNRKINDVAGTEALTASGGVCGPVAVDYNITTIAAADRPVRQAMAQFGATRGGLRFILPHTLAQVTADGPATVWTQANDASANPSPATKAHATFLCQAVTETYVDAVTSIVQFGNFQARYFPEQVTQYMETVDAVHSRLAEATLLAALSAGSSQMTADNYELGAAREFLAVIDRASAGYRSRHRLAVGTPLRLIYPRFLLHMIRADLARELPGDSDSGKERLATTEAEFNSWLAVRNINPSYTLDSPTGLTPYQGFNQGVPAAAGSAASGGAQLPPWPSSTVIWLFHEGAWMFLDGGELNLGMVRDSTLNRTNDFQMFSETFEKALFRGHESDQITLKIDPTGASSATVAPTVFTVGS